MVRRSVHLALAVIVFVAASLGLRNGVVMHVDDDGHLHIMLAYVLHAHEHEQGSDHDRHDHGSEGDHVPLHIEMGAGGVPSVVKASGVMPLTEASLAARPVVRLPIAIQVLSEDRLQPGGGTWDDPLQGFPAPAELLGLRTIVLTI